MAAYLSPVFGAGAQLFNNQGIVLSGGKIWTYQAGTTTPLATWTDSTQLVANANPIILDSAGRPSNEIWLQASTLYKFILTDSNNNTLGTWDNIAGLNDITSSVTVSEWVATSLTPSYISATSFSVPGNNTSVFPINRRVKIAVSAGTVYGYVVSSTFTSLTTVVIQPDSTSLDSGISSVNVGLLTSVNPSAPQQLLQMNAPIVVASASTTNIGAALSANVTISGVVTITAFDNVIAGIIKFVKFSGILTLTHNGTSLILITGANITTAAGDEAIFRSLGSGNWECLAYNRLSGYAFFSDFAASLQSGATAVTQAGQDNSTKIATDAYVDRQHDSQVFTTPGANTWTKPTWVMPNTIIEIECWGGGGGGGHSTSAGGGGGGGGGSYSCRRVLASALGATETATVGAAGTANGGNGGTSSLGTVVVAIGGTGGNGGAGQPGTGGPGGSNNSVATTLWDGSAGGSVDTASTNSIFGGGGGGGGKNAGGGAPAGGVSIYGGNGGAGANGGTAAPVAGTAPAGGGGGGDASFPDAAAGARGEVRVRVLS